MASALSHQRQYAFSLALYGVEGAEKDDHVLLQVGNWSSAAAVLTERRIDAITSEEELSTEINETGTKDRALWVGFRPLSSGVLRSSKADPIGKEDDITQVAFEEIKEVEIKRSLSVNSLSSLPELPIWPLTETMSKVVMRFNVQHSDRLTFYELVNRDAKTKLCNAVPIMVDDVFFFHPYRDDALTTSRDRRSGWGQTIKTYIAQQQKQETESVTATVSQPIGLPHLLDINHTFEQDDADKVLAFIIPLFPNLAKSGTLTSQSLFLFSEFIRKTQMHVTSYSLRSKLGMYLYYHRINASKDSGDRADKDDGHKACAQWMETYSDILTEETQGPPSKKRRQNLGLEH